MPVSGSSGSGHPSQDGFKIQTYLFQKPFLRFLIPDHFCIGVKMTSQNTFFTLGFWAELPQILGLGFSVFSVNF